MAKQSINVGTTANDKKGDSLRAAFVKVNANFTELYTALGLTDVTLNLGAFTFTGSTMSTDDSTNIVIDKPITVNGEITVDGDITPKTDFGASLGTPTKQFKSLYVSNNTIYIGGTAVGVDANGQLTVSGSQVNAPSSTLVNGANTVSLGSTGITTFPGVINAGNINNLVVNDLGGGTSLTAGSQVQIGNSAGIAGAGVLIKNAVTNTLGGEAELESGSKIQMDNGIVSLSGYEYTGLGGGEGLEFQMVVEVENNYPNKVVRIGTRIINTGVEPPTNVFQGVTISQYGELTFPDATVQTTAYNPSNIRSEGNINIDINLSDSTLRRWQFGEDGNLETPGGVQVAGILKIDDGVHEQFQAKVDATGVVTHDCSSGHIFYHTSPDANWTANFTNLNLSTTYATSVTLIIAQGATGYYPSAVQIAGSAQTINWQGNVNPTVSTSRTDVVTFSIINVSGTYTVLGQLTGF